MKIYNQHIEWLNIIVLLVTTDDTHCFEVKTTTKSYGSEISWIIGSCASSNEYGNNQEYTQQCCLPFGAYNLKCKDSYGDGWNGGFVEVEDTKYCDSFFSGSLETSEITIQGTNKIQNVPKYSIVPKNDYFQIRIIARFI